MGKLTKWTEAEHAASRARAREAFAADVEPDSGAYVHVPACEVRVGDWLMVDPDIAWPVRSITVELIDGDAAVRVTTDNGTHLTWLAAELVWVDARRPEA